MVKWKKNQEREVKKECKKGTQEKDEKLLFKWVSTFLRIMAITAVMKWSEKKIDFFPFLCNLNVDFNFFFLLLLSWE